MYLSREIVFIAACASDAVRDAYVQDRRISQTKYHCYVIESRCTTRYMFFSYVIQCSAHNEAILGLPSCSLNAVD